MKKADISSRLKHFRLNAGLSIKDVASKIGVAQSTYRDWEYGRAIKGEPYIRLASVFQVSLSELLNPQLQNEQQFILDSLAKIEELVSSIRSHI